MKSIDRGFTLIELMLAVAVIGILAVIAMPAYENYIVRSKMTELTLYASKCKNIIEESSRVKIWVVKVGDDWGCDERSSPLTQYVRVVNTTAEGVIRIEAQNFGVVGVNGNHIVLTPYSDADGTKSMLATDYLHSSSVQIAAWKCTFTGVKSFSPSSCR